MKIKRPTFVIKTRMLLFILLLLSYCLTSSDVTTNSNSLIKYIILVLCIVESGREYISQNTKRKEKDSYKGLFVFSLIIIIYTITRSILAMKFSFRTIQELIFLICPMIYAYFVINTWENTEINQTFKYGFIISFICYIISLDMNVMEIINALLNSSFSDSYSELESFTYCGLALAFCVYFCYFDKNKLYKLLSILFVVMTFKRLLIIIAFALYILSNTKLKNKKVPRKIVFLSTIFLCVLGIFYYWIMQPQIARIIEINYNIDLRKLTMGRNDRMRWLVESDYESYGFGSTTEFMLKRFYGALEMDISKIIIELGYLPMILLIKKYLQFSSASYYTFIFMVLMILNLTFSSGLAGTFDWCILFITISLVNLELKEKDVKNYEQS